MSRRRWESVTYDAPLVCIFGSLGFVYDGERLYVRLITARSNRKEKV